MESQIDEQPPIIIGIYGLPGSGKSTIMKMLKESKDLNKFLMHEGSEMIDRVCPGGRSQFRKLEEPMKTRYRALAIRKIQEISMNERAPALVAGHCSMWSKELSKPQLIWTEDDLAVYTHIIYIDTTAEYIQSNCLNDKEKKRPHFSIEEINTWKQFEKQQLRRLCAKNRLLFFELPKRLRNVESLVAIIRNFEAQTEDENSERARDRLDQLLMKNSNPFDKVLLLDCDKTVAPCDSGLLFWQNSSFDPDVLLDEFRTPPEQIFASNYGYSYAAFRQVILACEQWIDDQSFENICEVTAGSIHLYPEIEDLLRKATRRKHTRVMLITCGVRRIWEHVIKRYNFPTKIEVIGGGRLIDGYVVTPKVKGRMALALQRGYNAYVCAFGDSPLDSRMLLGADQAIIIAGPESIRSQTMERELTKLLDNPEFLPRQVVLSEDRKPFLDNTKIPIVSLRDPEFIDQLLSACLHVHHATWKNGAKLLAAPTRDRSVFGPRLNTAHKGIGRYLAIEYISEIIGLEEYQIQHVQGHMFNAHRLRKEENTVIVAVMRAGEPLAAGIHKVFPRARFLHANAPEDIQRQNITNMRSIILVDYVINSGATISKFIHHIRDLNEFVPIVVVAGVIHRQTIAASDFANEMSRISCLEFVALRLSNNRYKGKGALDTGYRLFGR